MYNYMFNNNNSSNADNNHNDNYCYYRLPGLAARPRRGADPEPERNHDAARRPHDAAQRLAGRARAAYRIVC